MVDRLMVKNLALYLGHYGIRFIFPLIATPFLAHVLRKEGFADFAIINSCIWTSTVFMEFGFYLYGVSKVGAAGDDHEALRRVVSTIAGSKLLLAPIAIAVYLGLTVWTGVLGREPEATLVGLVSALGYGASFAWYFQGRQRGLVAVLNEALPQLVQFGLLLAVVRSPDHLWLVLTLQAIPPVSSLTFSIATVLRAGLLRAPGLGAVREALVASSPFFVERFCYATYTSIMPSLIVLLASKPAVADYSVGDRFGTLVGGLIAPLTQAAMPRISRAVSTGDSRGGWRLSLMLVAGAVLVAGVLGLGLGSAADWIIGRFFPADYGGAVVVSRIFCVTATFSTLGFAVANFILIPRSRANVMFWSSTLALVFGLSAQFLLLPRWGAPGAAVGRLVAEASVAAVMVVAAIRLYRQEHPSRGSTPRP